MIVLFGMENLSEKYKDRIEKINSGIKVLDKRKKKLRKIKFSLSSDAWGRRDLAEILLEEIATKNSN